MAIIGVPIRYDYSKDENKPIMYIFDSLRRAIQKAGGDIFLIIPVQDVDYLRTKNSDIPSMSEEEKEKIIKSLEICDGLLLPGGSKFTNFDRFILDYAIDNDIPTLGICLSMQMMSCYNEEVKLVRNDTKINHNQSDDDVFCHSVIIEPDSKLFSIVGKRKILVNSFHNYHATENCIYRVVARSIDGIIEAIEHPYCRFNIGVQWHPERSYDSDDNSKKIIDKFIEEANIYRKSKLENKVKQNIYN